MTTRGPFLDPPHGASLSERQSQRAQALHDALALTHGRSVPIQIVWALARWLYDGSGPE